jgi:cytochrome P450
VLYIITSPRAYSRIQREIDSFSFSSADSVTNAEAKSLTYFQACIREGLRLFNPIGGHMERTAVVDDNILGYHIPAGTNVGMCIGILMRDPEVFGEDAEVFRPERWFQYNGESPEEFENRLKAMERLKDWTWGGTSYSNCLGKNIAVAVINKSVLQVSYNLAYPTSRADV